MNQQLKFHFFIGEKKPRRTTITVDLLLFEFMALKLGVTPDSDEAYSTVRVWIQDNIISNLDGSDERRNISQHVRQMLIHEIAQVKLANLRNAWLDKPVAPQKKPTPKPVVVKATKKKAKKTAAPAKKKAVVKKKKVTRKKKPAVEIDSVGLERAIGYEDWEAAVSIRFDKGVLNRIGELVDWNPVGLIRHSYMWDGEGEVAMFKKKHAKATIETVYPWDHKRTVEIRAIYGDGEAPHRLVLGALPARKSKKA